MADDLRFLIPIILFFQSLGMGSCAYKFTNRNLQLPQGINSIAVEAVYDTSREVLPHEILWESLQRAFAADGHLRLVSQGSADALLRAHITSGSVNPTGSTTQNLPLEDENVKAGAAVPPFPDDFRKLTQAGEYTTKEVLALVVQIEVIDLYSRAVIFSKSYSGAETFTSARTDQVAQKKSHYLLYEEALNTDFKRVAERISSDVVRDFIVGR